ncbi:Pimeloyl-ACP methyl ester carboxylesterase [Saccharopolyspora antimicrobica]|uniref:Pimeloyl-ACP methyl ester carboxylesterase n=1 Tax=Saccharopolyspora antimicrobica TaxID=455193 RepID=A0A1I4W048_9PSEU|nr:alpha/beta fold hydrolase [Saccharopolyspora antimicrobica]RKT87135.1 pimeloyl-ACP methyl ester carboxylesterase [Saccharopolyspora antimicrobica]SFN06830.1 Pimeloyl-ACP methyl ester carboxylesterase [Saccharopolyspora antimicrobica]
MIRRRVSDVDVLDAGKGTPLVLLHGIGGAAEAFHAQLTGLADAHRVIAWDAPGYGGSPDLPGEPELDAYADAVVSVLRGLDAEPAHLLGVSWGGVIATRVALKAPESLRSLVLADSSRGSGRTDRGRAAMSARVGELRRRGPAEFAALRSPRLAAPGADPAVVEQIVALMSRVRMPGYGNAARVMATTDHSAQLALITTPTLVVVGEQDQVTGVAESRALADGIPDARIVEIGGAGHAANQERPAEFNAAVREFLTEIDTRGGVL